MAHNTHDHGHATDASGASHGTTKQYIIGFILSVVLTLIPFWMVMNGGFDRAPLLWTIAITATAQVIIQLVFFLHMNTSSEQRWNLVAFVYTVLTVATLLIGSIWIMNYLHEYMMM